jgi:hypothetical protein
VRHMDIEGFERVGAGVYCQPEHRASLIDGACARLDRVSPALSSLVRGCSAIKAKHRMSSDDVLRALEAVTMPVVRESDSASVVVVAFTSVAFTVL